MLIINNYYIIQMCLVCKHLLKYKLYTDILYLNNPICYGLTIFPYIYPNLNGLNTALSYINIINSNYVQLKFLYAQYSSLRYISFTFVNLIELNISNTEIIDLPITLVNLEYLNCNYTSITKIPYTYNKLTKLFIVYTNINELSNNFSNLRILDCSFSSLTSISDKYINLERLNCKGSKLKIIPETLNNLKYLNCSYTNINKLSNNFINLVELHIQGSLIKSISHLYKNLKYLKKTNKIIYPNECQYYININFLITHFRSHFKYINKFKYINSKSIIKYSFYILDDYINPNSLALKYRINNWDYCNKSNNITLIYLKSKIELKIYNLIK